MAQQSQKILIRRGLRSELPTLDVGEFGLCQDTEELYYGTSVGNILVARRADIPQAGSIITTGRANGYITVNGIDMQVFDSTVLVNALSTKSDVGHKHALSDITDVDTTNKADGYILQYSASANKFVMVPAPTGSSGGSTVTSSTTNGNIKVNGTEVKVYDDTSVNNAIHEKADLVHKHNLADINDVDSSNKTDGYGLIYDATAQKFVSKALPNSGGGSLVTSSSTNGNIKINGTETQVYNDSTLRTEIGDPTALSTGNKSSLVAAINEVKSGIPTRLSQLTDINVSSEADGYGLIYDSTQQKFVSKPIPGGGGGATSMSGLSDVDVVTKLPLTGDVLGYSAGKWVPIAPPGGVLGGTYALELSRWGIVNSVSNTADVSLSTNNSNSLNNAMAWADANGYSTMVLQPGTYLINEKIGLDIPSYFTLDLGGATLRVRDNSEVGYGVITFQKNQMHSRVTNGTIQGDRWNHDYYSYNSDASVFKAWTFWAPTKAYAVGDKVMPTNTVGQLYGVYWQCTVAGTSGSTEPSWNTNSGTTTTSGGATFTSYNRHTHEWGHGVRFTNTPSVGANSRHISIDNLELFDLTGDGVAVMSTYGQIPVTGSNTKFSWEAGGIDTNTGVLTVDATRVRQSSSIDLTHPSIKKWGYIGIAGGSYGGLGSDISANNPYNLVFYNADGTFNSSVLNCEFFDEISVPSGATTAKVVLHQGNVPTSANDLTSLRVIEMPKYTYIEKCHIHHNRRCGISVTGAKQLWLRHCDIHDIKGTGPNAGIDIEDGYLYNQDIFIEHNFFHNTQVQLSFVAGKNIQIRRNRVYGGSNTTWVGVVGAVMEGNHIQDSSFTFIGEMNSSNNYFHRTNVTFPSGSTSNGLVNNCVFHNSSLTVARDKAYCILVSNSRFYDDSDYNTNISGFGFGAGIQPQTMTNCSFEGYLGSSMGIFGGDSSAIEGWSYSNLLFLNTKKMATSQVSVKLGRGTYTNCRFNNPGPMDFTKRVELIGCTFTWDGYNLFPLGGNTYDAMRFRDCTFNGGTSSAFYLSAYGAGLVEIINSVFNYPNSTSTSAGIIDGYWSNSTGGKIVLDGNRVSSNMAMKFINAPGLTADAIPILMRNNYLEGTVTHVMDETQIKYNNYIGGILDPYKWSATVPTSGYYRVGDQINNSNMATDLFMGWVCTKEGYMDTFPAWAGGHSYNFDTILVNGGVYVNTVWGSTSAPSVPTWPTVKFTTTKDINGIPTWSAGATHSVGDLVLPTVVGSYYYKCTAPGTSSTTEPTWGSGTTVTDGGVTWTKQTIAVWKYLGTSGVFKPFGLISE